MKTAEVSGTRKGFGWAVNLPWWTALPLFIVLAHGGMWTIAYVVEHRVLNWHNQFLAFKYGDILVGVAFLIARYGLRSLATATHRWWQKSWVQRTALGVCVFVAVYRWAWNDYSAYSVGQDASPTKLYHDLLFIVMGYLLLNVLLPLIGTRRWFYVALVLAMVAGWLLLGWADQGDGWKTQYAHVDYEWWFKDLVLKYLDPHLRR